MAGHDIRPAVLTDFHRRNLNAEGLAAADAIAEAFERLQRTIDDQCGIDGTRARAVRYAVHQAALWAMELVASRPRYWADTAPPPR